ncbi:hypothetical protein PVAP13_7KG415280 [Panicum virgatum]|uniref:Uncharacterized protein n=1 Tax=Panicum virgatum TaxID=38727 RepID=A0A8T0QQ97_PANVG|nr:hypothetical protein PVAP13_7KG415280 [Panicum virgatum]
MAVEVVPDPGGFRENNTQDPTTQRRRARYPPPTPPQVACPVSKEAGRQAGRQETSRETSRDIWWRGRCEPAASSQRQQPTRRRQPGGHLPSIWNPARVSPAAARCDDDSARAVSRPAPAPHHPAGLARGMMIPREPLRPEPPSDS